MRATDFVREAETGTPAAKEIEAKLTRAGYSKLGSGADATVWTKDEDTVIKILMPDEPSDSATLAFLKFYEFTQQHSNLSCLPKFREIGGAHHSFFMIGDVQYTQIAMERLYPIPSGSFEETMVWILSDMATGKQEWDEVVNIIHDPQTWKDFEGKGKLDTVIDTIDNWDDRTYNDWGILFSVMQMLYLTGQINRFGWDLHTENVMMRKSGSLVIIDPWFAINEGSL